MRKTKNVIVTTEHRGVFYGRLRDGDYDAGERTVRIEDARCAIYFGTTRGFLELADTGPTSKSRIGAPAPSIMLHGVTSIADVTDAAAAAWEQTK